jgi:hypothetical protein
MKICLIIKQCVVEISIIKYRPSKIYIAIKNSTTGVKQLFKKSHPKQNLLIELCSRQV